jgi:hypothetical protein
VKVPPRSIQKLPSRWASLHPACRVIEECGEVAPPAPHRYFAAALVTSRDILSPTRWRLRPDVRCPEVPRGRGGNHFPHILPQGAPPRPLRRRYIMAVSSASLKASCSARRGTFEALSDRLEAEAILEPGGKLAGRRRNRASRPRSSGWAGGSRSKGGCTCSASPHRTRGK